MADESPTATPPRRWGRRLLSGPKVALSTLLLGALGVAAVPLWNFVYDSIRPTVAVTASLDQGVVVGDYTHAAEQVLLPERAEQIGSPADFVHGPAQRNTVKVGTQGASVTIQGAQSNDVMVTDIRPHILNRSPNVSGTLFCAPPQGESKAIRLGFDLDSIRPVAHELDDDRDLGPYFANRAVRLGDGETQVFNIQASAEQGHYTWELRVELVVNGQRQTRVVRPETGPFETTGINDHYGSVYQFAGSFWTHPDPAEPAQWSCS